MIRVKVSARGGLPATDLSQFVGNLENRWDSCVFSINQSDSDADVWIVVEDVDDGAMCRVPPERVVFVSAETSWAPNHYAPQTIRDDFLDQFSHIYSCHDIFRWNVSSVPPLLPWMINANHGPSLMRPHARDIHFLDKLSQVPKSRQISVFCSNQVLTPNHRMRLRFVDNLKSHFGSSLDWFGNGINPIPEKWEGIAPYRYTIVLENQSAENIISEKLYDAYLGLAFPIYWGAPNVLEFFPPGSLTSINIRDFRRSIDVIEELLQSSVAEERINLLLEAKRRVLWDYNLFARLASIAERQVRMTAGAKEREVELWSWSSREARANRVSIVRKVSSQVMRRGRGFLEGSQRPRSRA